jgi:hypothetical protein
MCTYKTARMRKREKEVDQQTLVLASLSKKKYNRK